MYLQDFTSNLAINYCQSQIELAGKKKKTICPPDNQLALSLIELQQLRGNHFLVSVQSTNLLELIISCSTLQCLTWDLLLTLSGFFFKKIKLNTRHNPKQEKLHASQAGIQQSIVFFFLVEVLLIAIISL
jgi:hypothetical protein